ncbi:MAG: hypothetical protein ACYC5X_16920 [Syntrophales bacterium]
MSWQSATKGLEPAQSSYTVGAGLTLMTKSDVTFALNNDFEKKEDFSSHSDYVNLRYTF